MIDWNSTIDSVDDTIDSINITIDQQEPKNIVLARIVADTINLLGIEPMPGPQGERGERGEKGDRGDVGPQGEPGISPPPSPPNYDGRINVRAYGVVVDGFTDAAPGINAAIEYAKSRFYGGTVYIPAGYYVLHSPIIIDYSDVSGRLNNQVKLVGDGLAQTRFYCPNGDAVVMQGNVNWVDTHFEMSGMSFRGPYWWGTGLSVKIGAFCRFDDVAFENFATGGVFEDFEQCLLTNCYFSLNSGDGLIVLGKGYTSDPNSNTFINCTFVHNKRGMTYNAANAVTFLNGSFQYNGDMTLDPTISYGIKFVNPGSGYGNVNITGTIFEQNGGCADIWWHAGDVAARFSSLAMVNTSFIRTSNEKYTNHNVWITGNAPSKIIPALGSTFKRFNTYVPSALRKYFHNDNPNATVLPKVDENYYQDAIEAP